MSKRKNAWQSGMTGKIRLILMISLGRLIYLLAPVPRLEFPENGSGDGVGTIDIGDLTKLIDLLFILIFSS
jgi:hypothetical protein